MPPSSSSPFDNLYKYYRILNPNIDIESGQATLHSPTFEGVSSDKEIGRIIYQNYINGSVSGETLVNDAQLRSASKKGLYFNTIHQKGDTTNFLEQKDYFSILNEKGDVENINNYYTQVCGREKESPPVAFTINLLRSPLLSNSRKDVDEITFFLNYMPPTFASKMIPYFDVEFQFPLDSDKNSPETAPGVYPKYLNKPSLLRFLMGSANLSNVPLTAADKSLIQSIETPTVDSAQARSHFLGMEYFTTPQTLVNMDNLRANEFRVVDAKPFLPPATIMSCEIQAANAGAGVFIHTTARLVMKIHDKNRLTEFSEFLRGGPGYNDATIWLTYGWLAPRSNTDEDIYAKFINHTMLKRQAYQTKNSSFAFSDSGEVTVTIELVSKGVNKLQTNSLDSVGGLNLPDGKSIEDGTNRLREIARRVQKTRSAFGEPSPENEELRIFQILNAAAAGEFEIDIEPAKISESLVSAVEGIAQNKNLSDKEKREATEVVTLLLQVYADPKVNGFIGKLKKDVFDYVNKRMEKCYKGIYDPFLASNHKADMQNNYFGADLCNAINAFKKTLTSPGPSGAKPQDANYKPETGETVVTNPETGVAEKVSFIKNKNPALPGPGQITNDIVSFGKIFSIFCMPPLLKVCKDEGIEELQINFYQFNDSCGPLSYHNIAEFPINIRSFLIHFQHFVRQRGGAKMTLQQFLSFVINTQIMDSRAPGYDMFDAYEPIVLNKLEESKDKDYDAKMSKWFAKYREFVKPAIAMYSEVETDQLEITSTDLLQKIGSKVGSYYTEAQKESKKIKKIHIYDKAASLHSSKSKKIIRDNTKGSSGYYVVENKDALPAFAVGLVLGDASRSSVLFQNSPEAYRVNDSRSLLRDFVSNTVPTIEIGANGSLVRNVSIASKTDGYIGVMNLQGGSGRAKSDLTDSGIQSATNNLPVRLTPAQLTLKTVGCPIAALYQQYYINLGTGTTLDNIFTATTISHSLSPGSFSTNWTFAYYDGYGRFFGAAQLQDVLEDLKPDVLKAIPTAVAQAAQPSVNIVNTIFGTSL